MAIYKHVTDQTNFSKSLTKENVPLGINDPDECFEYFSDKEEAEKYRNSQKRDPKLL